MQKSNVSHSFRALYLKKLLFALLLISCQISTSAQTRKEYYNYSVHYYEFVDDIQMVMVVFGLADHKQAFDYSRMNSSMPIPDPNPTIYLFRKRNGEIISSYNLCGSKISDYNIKSPESVSKKELQKHRSNRYSIVENTTTTTRFNNRFSLKYADVDLTNAVWGIIDRKGKVIIKPIYNSVFAITTSHVLQARQNGKWGLLDSNGKILQPFVYEEMTCISYNGGSILAKRKGKYSFMDNRGVVISKREYDFAETFWSRRARVAINNRFGYIDSAGNEIVPLIYKTAEPFYYNVAIVGDGKKFGMINNTGEIIEPLIYDRIIDNYDEKKMVTVGYFGFLGEKKLLFDRDGKKIGKKR